MSAVQSVSVMGRACAINKCREEPVEIKLLICIVQIEVVNLATVWGSAIGREKADKIFRR